MTTKQRAEALAKGSTKAMETVMSLMDDENANLKLKAALSVLDADYKFRELLMKEVKHKLEVKKMEKELKDLGKDKDNDGQDEEDHSAPVISLKAVD